MDKILFGELLGRLLYLSNQKKSSLAKELGYDISYISKWINSKNLPSPKNANIICKDISNFIVNSLNESTANDIIKYFEFDIDDAVDKNESLIINIEKCLKSSYLSTVGNKSVVTQETYEQERYNSKNYINPRLRKRFLTEDIYSYIEKEQVLDVFIYISLADLSFQEKKILLTCKSGINEFEKKDNLRIKFLIGFEYTKESLFIDSMIIINMISTYPNLNFEVYHCDIARSIGLVSIKDRLSYIAIIQNDGTELLINTSKEKEAVNELYFSMEKILNAKGSLISEIKKTTDIIGDTTYIQHILGGDLRWIMGNINELFMPEDLFMDIAKRVFKEDEKILQELKKINIFFENITYKSGLRALIYESGIKKYILSGELSFFNNVVTLTFEERSRHMQYLEKLLKENDGIEIRIIEEKNVDEMYNQENISMTLSDTFKIIEMDANFENGGYSLVNNDSVKKMCDNLFSVIWEKSNITDKDKENFAQKICKAVDCLKILNEKKD